MSNYEGPGIYRHYKGGRYEVLGLGVHEHAKEHQPTFDANGYDHQYVIYRPLTGSFLDGKMADFWMRKLSDFDEFVDEKPRFVKLLLEDARV